MNERSLANYSAGWRAGASAFLRGLSRNALPHKAGTESALERNPPEGHQEPQRLDATQVKSLKRRREAESVQSIFAIIIPTKMTLPWKC